jgi:hypothetical protein
MVMTPSEGSKLDDRPRGKFITVAPVAPVVLYVIGVIAVFTQTVWSSVPGAEVRVMVLSGCTVMVPETVVTPAQPPVKVTV